MHLCLKGVLLKIISIQGQTISILSNRFNTRYPLKNIITSKINVKEIIK